MDLEKTDLSRLTEVGWKLPETFVVKAADGVTDLYGNMWKPFDFDPKKKYPIIAHVYPGPQPEGTTHTFSATSGQQQLAQLGFIVIQVGHRGGTPPRSKAYASYGYFNLRDYGLADKKAAIEQLAARHPFIDITRVGIYGHSGGGFMSAAALLQKPYNEFFKVGVASAGNHDNNIYNNIWAERYHGLKEVEVKEQIAAATGGRTAGQSRRQRPARAARRSNGRLRTADFPRRVQRRRFRLLLRSGNDRRRGGVGRVLGSNWPPTLKQRVLAEQENQSPQQGTQEQKSDGQKTEDKTDAQKKEAAQEKKTKFEIHVPTNAELAGNLKGKLLLVHGEADNNVHPANTLRLVDALIKANKRFDMLYLPATRHSFGGYQPYVTQRMYEYFAEHLLGDYQASADIMEKSAPQSSRR